MLADVRLPSCKADGVWQAHSRRNAPASRPVRELRQTPRIARRNMRRVQVDRDSLHQLRQAETRTRLPPRDEDEVHANDTLGQADFLHRAGLLQSHVFWEVVWYELWTQGAGSR